MPLNDPSSSWQDLLSRSITSTRALGAVLDVDGQALEPVVERYPLRINPYYFSLIRQKDDPIYRQCVPDIRELTMAAGMEDPLAEEASSPVPGLTHRYPDRVLLLVSSQCAVYCRFCNRKRKVGCASMVTDASIERGLRYIQTHAEVRDVLLSGGDPLLLPDHRLAEILAALRRIPHVEIIRIGSRVPCTLPQRVTPQLTDMLKRYHPLYLHTHFNHPREITPQAATACNLLADAGLPLGCQTVLLKGVNDDADTMRTLMQKLLTVRVRPYYLFQADLVKGTAHFWTALEKGLEIIERLQGHTSGLCVPHFAVDLPGGGGKVPLLPAYSRKIDPTTLLMRNYCGKEIYYPCQPI